MAAFDSPDLTGKFLIAMPGMADSRFDRAVVYLCAHSAEGAMGLIVNKPARGTTLTELLEQLSIAPIPDHLHKVVRYGGPVERGRGFVLHSADWRAEEGTLSVDDRFSMTGTLDVLRVMSEGGGPGQAILALGYAGWGPGQLEEELSQNGWLTADAHPRVVFDLPDAEKWEAALAVLGIDPLFLSAAAGRA